MRPAFALSVGWIAIVAGCGGKLLNEGTEGAPALPDEDAGVATDAAIATPGGCDVSGGWALKMAIAVSWSGSGAVLGGTGEVDLWALIDAAPGTDSLTVTLRPCGAALPDFSSILGETYGLAFPSDLFDHAPP